VGQEPVEPDVDEQSMAEQLAARAREKGVELVGPDGLLSQLTKRVLEIALEAEISEHLRSYSATEDSGWDTSPVRSHASLPR
jgi:putative transposase